MTSCSSRCSCVHCNLPCSPWYQKGAHFPCGNHSAAASPHGNYQVSVVFPSSPGKFSKSFYTFLDSRLHNGCINSFLPPLDLLLKDELAQPHLNNLLIVALLDLPKAYSQHFLILVSLLISCCSTPVSCLFYVSLFLYLDSALPLPPFMYVTFWASC